MFDPSHMSLCYIILRRVLMVNSLHIYFYGISKQHFQWFQAEKSCKTGDELLRPTLMSLCYVILPRVLTVISLCICFYGIYNQQFEMFQAEKSCKTSDFSQYRLRCSCIALCVSRKVINTNSGRWRFIRQKYSTVSAVHSSIKKRPEKFIFSYFNITRQKRVDIYTLRLSSFKIC